MTLPFSSPTDAATRLPTMFDLPSEDSPDCLWFLTEAEAALQVERVAKELAQSQLRQGVLNLHNMGFSIAQIAQTLNLTEAMVAAIIGPDLA